MISAMRAQFEAQRLEVLAHLDVTRIGKSYGRKDWLADLLDRAAANQSFAEAIKPIIQTILSTTGRSALSEVGRDPSQYDPFTPAILEYFRDRSVKIAQDVDEETAKQLQRR
jgi:hypothetical protein